MPGQDFDTPSLEKIQEFFDTKWKPQKDEEVKKRLFFEFMEENVNQRTVDDNFFIMAGLAAPAAAVIGKRASGHIPYVKNLKLEYVPNVVFVPMCTLLAIVGAAAAQMNKKSRKSAAAKKEEESAAAKKKGVSTAAERGEEEPKAT